MSVHSYGADVMFARAVKTFAVGDGARRFALDSNTGEPIVNVDDDGETIDSNTAGAMIDRQAKALAATAGIPYAHALSRVMSHPDNEQIVAIYNHRVGPGDKLVPRRYASAVDDPQARNAASAKLHNLAVAEMQRNPELTYKQACERVCANPATAALRRSWTGLPE